MLLGSNIQPPEFKFSDGSVVQLGEIVRFAVRRGQFTEETWNALPDDERERRIESARKWTEIACAEPGGLMAGNPDAPEPIGSYVSDEIERQRKASSAGDR